MEIKLNNDERLDDLEYEGLKIIQKPNLYCFSSDAVLLANLVKCKASSIAVSPPPTTINTFFLNIGNPPSHTAHALTPFCQYFSSPFTLILLAVAIRLCDIQLHINEASPPETATGVEQEAYDVKVEERIEFFDVN